MCKFMRGSLKTLLTPLASEERLLSNCLVLELNNLQQYAIQLSLPQPEILRNKFAKGLLLKLFDALPSSRRISHLVHRKALIGWSRRIHLVALAP